MSDLEAKVQEHPLLRVPPLEEYVKGFTAKYRSSAKFRKEVAEYLELSRYSKMVLQVTRTLRRVLPHVYERRVDRHITEYATHIRDRTLEKRDLLRSVLAGEGMLQDYEDLKTTERAAEQTVAERQHELDKHAQTYAERQATLAQQRDDEKAAVVAQGEEKKKSVYGRFDPRKLAADAVAKFMGQNELVKKDASGRFVYNNQRIMGRLEDMLLDQFVYEIESETGGGFLSKLGSLFEESGDYEYELRPLEDFSELMDMDVATSIAESNAHGYALPTYPFIFVQSRKPVMKSLGSIGVDNVTVIDVSGSMFPELFPYAQQMGLACNGLMRRLHPNNKSILGAFSDTVYELSAEQLYRAELQEHNHGTRTELALNWALSRVKGTGRPSIVNLVTDGLPNNMDATLEAARQYQDQSLVQLCIYFLDPAPQSIRNMRQVGVAAGEGTRFLPIKVDHMGRDVIQTIADSLTSFYNNQAFAAATRDS